jgi:hypothetical protein
VIEHEWVHLTGEQLSADPALVRAIEGFQAPPGRAGDAAAAWLKERALRETSHIATYVLLVEGDVAGFYSLGMSEVELRSQHRKGIDGGLLAPALRLSSIAHQAIRRGRPAAKPALAAALLRDLGGLPGAHARPRRFRHVLLGVQAELAPALIAASLGKLVCVDHRRHLNRLLRVGGSREDMSLIIGHLT